MFQVQIVTMTGGNNASIIETCTLFPTSTEVHWKDRQRIQMTVSFKKSNNNFRRRRYRCGGNAQFKGFELKKKISTVRQV